MKLEHGGDWLSYKEKYGSEPIDFSANISPLGMPKGAIAAAGEALPSSDRYPDPLCRELRDALSAYHNVPADHIVCGAGAADLIYRIAMAVHPKHALVPAPTFSEYAHALKTTGCDLKRYTLSGESDFHLDEGISDFIGPGLDLLILCEPNNPTGLTSSPDLLQKILQHCRKAGVLLVVDECFMPFLDTPEEHSMIPMLGNGNLVVLRAFTKFYGMAGLRLGYALTGDPALADKLRKCGQPWPVSTPAQAAGIAALRDRAYAEELRSLIREERGFLQDGLQKLGLRVIPGEANFLLFFSPDPDLHTKLAEHGILIRNCGNYAGLERGWYRVAVRSHLDNEFLLYVLNMYT